MLKKRIQYENADGQDVVEEAYFHLSKADLIKMEVSMPGGMQAHLQKIIDSQNGKDIIDTFEDLIRRSYGLRSPDGKFVRNAQKTEEFMASEAYSELFMGLVTDTSAAADFVNGVMPKGLEEIGTKIAGQAAAQALSNGDAPPLPESRVLTREEMIEMDGDELQSGLATGRYKLA